MQVSKNHYLLLISFLISSFVCYGQNNAYQAKNWTYQSRAVNPHLENLKGQIKRLDYFRYIFWSDEKEQLSVGNSWTFIFSKDSLIKEVWNYGKRSDIPQRKTKYRDYRKNLVDRQERYDENGRLTQIIQYLIENNICIGELHITSGDTNKVMYRLQLLNDTLLVIDQNYQKKYLNGKLISVHTPYLKSTANYSYEMNRLKGILEYKNNAVIVAQTFDEHERIIEEIIQKKHNDKYYISKKHQFVYSPTAELVAEIEVHTNPQGSEDKMDIQYHYSGGYLTHVTDNGSKIATYGARNEHGDLLQLEFFTKDYQYLYDKYDEANNWLEKNELLHGKRNAYIKRQITYH